MPQGRRIERLEDVDRSGEATPKSLLPVPAMGAPSKSRRPDAASWR
jgi:hypothetical protein